MGNIESTNQELSPFEIEELEYRTHFTGEELQKLWKAFVKIAHKDTRHGKISPKEFMDALTMKNEDFGKMIFNLFDTHPDGKLTFSEFIVGISQICERASIDEKAMFCFKLFDKDKNFVISKQEFLSIVIASFCIDNNMRIVDAKNEAINLFVTLDTDKDGVLEYYEFIKATEMQNNMLRCVDAFVEQYLN